MTRREELANEIYQLNRPFMGWKEAYAEADFWLAYPKQESAAARSRRLVWPVRYCQTQGCTLFVPSNSDGYPGMPQSHCYYCGKIGDNAQDGCTDWTKPIGTPPPLPLRVLVADTWAALKAWWSK